MSFFHAVAMHLAAAAANADPVGPNACPGNLSFYESDPVKGWYSISWTNGDSSAYTQVSEDYGATVLATKPPGQSGWGEPWVYWTLDDGDGRIMIRHIKNGIVDDCDWQAVGLL
jgi:hypothetical protein